MHQLQLGNISCFTEIFNPEKEKQVFFLKFSCNFLLKKWAFFGEKLIEFRIRDFAKFETRKFRFRPSTRAKGIFCPTPLKNVTLV